MISARDIIHVLSEWAPPAAQAEWDNSGLQIGDVSVPVQSVLITLDLSLASFECIKQQKPQMVITHHPLFFKPVKRLSLTSDIGRIVKTFVKEDMVLYAMHTNLDIAVDGVNDALIRAFGLDPQAGTPFRDGFGKWFELDSPVAIDELAARFPSRKQGYLKRDRARRIGFCCGAGRGLLSDVHHEHIDVYITGEVGYHDELFCEWNGITVLQLGHRESEECVLPVIQSRIRAAFPTLQTAVC